MSESSILLSGNFFFSFMIFLIGLLVFLLFYCIQLRRAQSVARREHKACLDKLEKHNGILDQVFNNLPDQLYYKDRQARLVGINPACYHHHGVDSPEKLIGKTDIDFKPAPSGQLSYERELRQMESKETIRNREEYELADGTICHVENIKKPLIDENGDVIGLVGVTRDISEQVRNEQERIRAQKEAEDANKAKSSFLAMMSHEIRTPMHGIIGAASLLSHSPLNSNQQDLLRTIEASGENLMMVLNDILDYSKIEAGKVQLEIIPFNLRECIHEALDLFVGQANKKGIELLLYTDSNVPQALAGDPTRVRQILLNLINNALKFTEKGEIVVHAKFLPENECVDHPHLQFSVKDTGIGISEQAQKQLFSAFTQADISSTRKYGGTGLGLAISKRLTELMGGSMWVESEVGVGSTFFFTIDLPTSTPPRKKIMTAPKNGLNGKRILIVDDNETNLKILSGQLQSWGATFDALSVPQEVVSHMKEHPAYDLAILDYRMPGINGADLVKAIDDDPEIESLPIILLSSSCDEIPSSSAISLRMNKPVRIDKLQKNIINLMSVEKPSHEPEPRPTLQPVAQDETTHILLAEDQLENQALIEQMVRAVGYNSIESVNDGLEAVEAIKQKDFDIILMDVQMPNMNGLDATRLIRKHTKSCKKPWVIALTAGVTQEEKDLMEEAGMNDLLPKPMKLDQLKQMLNTTKQKLFSDNKQDR